MEEKLIGFGGGKGGGGSPDVIEVSGISEAYVEVLLGLGEGRIPLLGWLGKPVPVEAEGYSRAAQW